MDLNELMKNPDSIKQLISVLEKLLPENSTSKNTEENIDEYHDPVRTKTGKSNFSRARPNKFESMSEKGMHKDDTEIDKKLSKHPPVARARDFQTIRVKCRVCGDEQDVSPSLVTSEVSRYKCNKCSVSAG